MTQAVSMVDLLSAGPMNPVEEVHGLYARLRREDPVHRMEVASRPTVFVSRFADVCAVLKDHETFSSRSSDERGIGLVLGRTLIGMDGREHLRHRALITPSLAPRALRGDFPKRVDRIAHELIDGFAEQGAADLLPAFTFVYPLRVFTEILGLPPDDVRTFHDWAIDLSRVAEDPQRGLASAAKMKDYLAPLVEHKRAHPGDDLISKLATEELDGARLSDENVVSFLRLLVIAGAETTYHLLGTALVALLRDAALQGRVRADRSLIAPLLDETLRWESPVQIISRETLRDTVLAGVAVAAGTDVIAGIGSANRDESRFPDADRFDIDRQGESHIAFGFGNHYCAGSRFALLEATLALDALLDRLPELRADPEAAPSRVVGIAFRGPDHLRVRFEVASRSPC